MTTETLFALCQLLTLTDGQPAPVEIKLLDLGWNATGDGRRYLVEDQAHAAAICAASPARPKPIDYDHAIDLAAKEGRPAPAAGWISGLIAKADGIWAKVDWTERGGKSVGSKEYRFISPAFGHDKATGKVTAIFRAALTNNPALDLPALAHLNPKTETLMTKEQMEALATALGLKADADATALCAAAEIAGTAHKTLLAVAAKAGLKAETKAADIETALCAIVDGAAADKKQLGVLGGQVLELNAQLIQAQSNNTQLTAEQQVDLAIASGKVAPAMRDAAVALCANNPDGFKAFVEKAPKIVTATATVPAAKPNNGSGNGGLDAIDLALCSNLGIDPEEYAKQYKKDAA